MEKEEVFNIFFREKPAHMLIVLHNSKSEIYASTLAKQVDCTYSHVVKVLQQLEDAGLLKFNKTGRLKLLALTKKGQDIAENISRIRGAL